ncbi:unnamed protein product [Paramecium sonneborni]|uniref:Uncharacterized protein n=1 Tax=Paramecium sonneborni TaxID=65129 RepID=A0A8S1QE19_9CILI|nr:unnamed protein product [Paramecium sonneborni]CAD8117261.1 unnamed protein product [Paramecium sonneborni]
MSQMEPYREEFLEELDKIRQQYSFGQTQQMSQSQQKKVNLQFKVTDTNDIWNTSKYSDNKWRGNLTTTFYNKEHNASHYEVNSLLNPEVTRKNFNMRATQISEYSNAKHNNTVFVNPKFTSC